jgi:hypothetical protein
LDDRRGANGFGIDWYHWALLRLEQHFVENVHLGFFFDRFGGTFGFGWFFGFSRFFGFDWLNGSWWRRWDWFGFTAEARFAFALWQWVSATRSVRLV